MSTPMSLDLHAEWGEELYRLRLQLQAMAMLATGNYGMRSAVVKRINETIDSIDKIRLAMDDKVQAEYPGRCRGVYFSGAR